jgi:hypothetical protein
VDNLPLTLTGRWFGEKAARTAMATILFVLRIDYARGPNGQGIEIKPEYTTGGVV